MTPYMRQLLTDSYKNLLASIGSESPYTAELLARKNRYQAKGKCANN